METTKHGVRRFADYVNTKEYPMKIHRLRTYLSFNIQKNDMPATEINGFLNQVIGQKFGLLRVLDLERVYKPKLPNNIGKLFLLLSSYLVGFKATKRSHANPRAAAKPFCPQAIGQFLHREGNEVPFRMVPASNFEALDAKDLDTWEVGKGALSSLRELEIRHCDKLKGLPDELLSLGNIEIVLTNMPPEFVANVRAVNLEENLSLSQTLEF
nr:hypothetical protein CFP56_16009 [Quercus suber]